MAKKARKPARKAAKTTRKSARKPAKKAASSMPAPAQGAWIWHELMTTNPSAARQFYGGLFGWKFGEMPMGPGRTYTLIRHGGKDNGGMMGMDGSEWKGIPPHWMIYVAVDDVDKTAAQCAKLGGTVCVPPTDIPVGRFAVLNDPQGAAISIYKPK